MTLLPLWPVWLANLVSIAFGLAVGSFLNVVIARMPRKLSIVHPRSSCPKCAKPIAWYDNIPVLSYLALRGKCRSCKSEISVRYPVIELLTALLFLAAKLRFGWNIGLLIRDWPFIASLIALTFIDLEHRILPDKITLTGLAYGLATSWLVPEPGVQGAFLGAAVGFSVFYLLAWVYLATTRRSGLGGGDIKLLAMLGAFLGVSGVFTTILISSIFGSVVGIGWALIRKEKNLMGVAIPFGPFLVIGALVHYLIGDILWFQIMIQR